MEGPRENSQSEERLQFLLEYLACPLDPSTPLSPVRDPQGKVVALRSKEAQYPVVHNIPCLIPDLGKTSLRNAPAWQGLLRHMWKNYVEGEPGVFSSSDHAHVRYLGEILREAGPGLFLDIGCGALPRPAYMGTTDSPPTWIGIDPFFGDAPRQFPFVQAIGEYLPFRPHVFDGALYAWTSWHQVDPLRSLKRARTVLKPQGRLYIVHEPVRVKPRYVLWKAMQALGWLRHYDGNSRWAFTDRSLHSLLEGAGFGLERTILLCERCEDFGTCPDPRSYLVVAEKRAP